VEFISLNVTFRNAYVKLPGRLITTRYKEHHRYITNNLTSARHTHIQHTRIQPNWRDFKTIKTLHKSTRINYWEALLMQYPSVTLISDEQVTDTNPLFDLAYILRDLQHISWLSSCTVNRTPTQHGRSDLKFYYILITCRIPKVNLLKLKNSHLQLICRHNIYYICIDEHNKNFF
jgi:hypothetical protein